MNSALVNNQNGADTSLVALIACVLTAVILLLLVIVTKRLRRRSLSRGVYKTYFFHLFLILHTHFDHILRKDRKNIYFQGEMEIETKNQLLKTNKVIYPWRFIVIVRQRTHG